MKICGCLLVLVLSASSAFADNFTVNSTRDATDARLGDGACSTGLPRPDGTLECTLRAAIQEANHRLLRLHRIHVPAGVYTLTRRRVPSSLAEDMQQGTAALPIRSAISVGDLDIGVSIHFTGDGAAVTVIDGGDVDRVFDIWPGASEVSFQQLTIRNGFSQRQGGCIWNQSRTILAMTNVIVEDCIANEQVGGGLYNNGVALLERVTFRNNVAVRGGGMESSFAARVNESTFSGNTATPALGREGGGGAISNLNIRSGEPGFEIRNSLISGNQAEYGGGILNHGALGLINSTVSGNRAGRGSAISFRSAFDGGGRESLSVAASTIVNNTGVALEVNGADSYVSATILAGNVGPLGVGQNCNRMIRRSNYTFEDGRACLLIGTGDRFDVDPMIGPLANNGGPTLTHALLEGSPAIDVLPDPVRTSEPQPRDQRGVPRPVGVRADIGAYEFGMDPFELILLIPIDWTFFFSTSMTTHAAEYSAQINLLTLGKSAASPRIVDIKAAEGQSQIKFDVDPDGRSVKVTGVAVPPKQGSEDLNPPLFYVLVQQGLQWPGLLYASTAACDCDAKPNRPPVPILIPRYKPKKP